MDFVLFLMLVAGGRIPCGAPYLSNYAWCDLGISVFSAISCHIEFLQHNRREFLIADHILKKHHTEVKKSIERACDPDLNRGESKTSKTLREMYRDDQADGKHTKHTF